MNPRLVSSSNQIQMSVTTISRHDEDVINHLVDAEIPRNGGINEVRSTRYSALKEKTPRISQYIRDPRSVGIVLDFARKPMKKTVIEIRRKQRFYAGSSPSVFQQTTAASSQLKIMSIVATIC